MRKFIEVTKVGAQKEDCTAINVNSIDFIENYKDNAGCYINAGKMLFHVKEDYNEIMQMIESY